MWAEDDWKWYETGQEPYTFKSSSAHIHHGVGPTTPGSHVVCHVLDLSVRESSAAADILAANQGASLAAKLHAIRGAVKENQQQHEGD